MSASKEYGAILEAALVKDVTDAYAKGRADERRETLAEVLAVVKAERKRLGGKLGNMSNATLMQQIDYSGMRGRWTGLRLLLTKLRRLR